MKHIYTTRAQCRVCDGELETVWDLGLQFIYSLKENNAAPLTLTICKKCELVQLKHTVDPDKLYGGEYYYKSGVNDSMRDALADVVGSALRYVPLKEGDWVIDIGSNDGTLLSNYPKGIFTLGFEPSDIYRMDIKSTRVVHAFFNAEQFTSDAKVITACAMFYDLDDPLAFLLNVRTGLADDGVFIIQMNYLKSMVDNCNFDNISHEHLCYYSIKDMKVMCAQAGLFIEDAELNNVNGGSIRLYIRKDIDQPIGQSDRLAQLMEKERIWHEDPYFEWREKKGVWDRLQDMHLRAHTICNKLRSLTEKKRACAVGASTRGYVILQLAGLELPCIDRNPEKVGKSLGNMPIKGEESIDDYEVGIVLPYHFMDEMRARYADKKIKLISAIQPA